MKKKRNKYLLFIEEKRKRRLQCKYCANESTAVEELAYLSVCVWFIYLEKKKKKIDTLMYVITHQNNIIRLGRSEGNNLSKRKSIDRRRQRQQ